MSGTYRVGCFGFDREGLACQGLHRQLHDGCGSDANPAMLAEAELLRVAADAAGSAAAALEHPLQQRVDNTSRQPRAEPTADPTNARDAPDREVRGRSPRPPPTRRSLSTAKRAGAPSRCAAGWYPRLRPHQNGVSWSPLAHPTAGVAPIKKKNSNAGGTPASRIWPPPLPHTTGRQHDAQLVVVQVG